MQAHRSLMAIALWMVTALSSPFACAQLQDNSPATPSETPALGEASRDANPQARAVAEPSGDPAVAIPDRDARRAADPVVDPAYDPALERRRQFEDLERQVSREPTDEVWARRTCDQLRESFDALVRAREENQSPPAILSVLCRTLLCRLEVAHTAEDDALAVVADLPDRLGWSGSVLLDRPTALTTVVYLTRPQPELTAAKK